MSTHSMVPEPEGRPSGTALPTLDTHFDFDTPFPRTAQEFTYQTVRRAIMRGALRPGTRLGQGQLADQLKVSTTPVREALRRLASEGLVRIDAHRGTIVTGLDHQELSEIYELRLVLEPLAIRKAVEHITDAQLDAAQILCDKMDTETDNGVWSELNRSFHAIFAEAAHSPRLVRIVGSLRDSAAPYVQWSLGLHPELPSEANAEHAQLVSAMRRRDADAAAEIEDQHLRATLAAIMGTP